MILRPAPGPQLSVGRIRVDAARAIAKLREYQLAERPAWILEAIRAAVAAPATAIELRGDANDVWLAWHGAPIATEDLPRLFDELVSPEATSERHHLRLLAAGVNSALGMNPAFIDVYSLDGAGGAMRARYTPGLLDEPTTELGARPLDQIIAEPHAVPVGAPTRGVFIHLRRRVSLSVIGMFVIQAEPPELGFARRACRDIMVPLQIGAETVLQRDRHARDVVRLPLDEGLDGFIAVVDPEDAGLGLLAVLEIAERGVVLVSYGIELGQATKAALPIRVFVDAARMPTNASRSQVRRDEYPIAPAIRRARVLLPAVLEALARMLAGDPLPAQARAAALAMIASEIAGSQWRWDVLNLTGPLRALADLPLLRDATGQPRACTSAWSDDAYTGKTALDADLRPWLEGLLWIPPGDPGARLRGAAMVDRYATRDHLRAARRQRTAHAKFFAHAPRAAVVIARTQSRIALALGAGVATSAVDGAVFTGLTGEVCVYGSGTRATLVILHHGRELEHLEYASPIAYDAVIDSAAVSAGERYRGVRRDAEFARVEHAARAGVIRAIEVLCERDLITTEADARLVRAALGLALEAGITPTPPLTTAAAWETFDGGWVSSVTLGNEPAIGVVSPNHDSSLPLGRSIVRADLATRALLAKVVPVLLIPYMFHQKHTAATLAATLGTERHALALQELGVVAVIAAAPQATLALHHLGKLLGDGPYAWRVTPCAIAIDDDALMPDAAWTRALDVERFVGREFGEWETALLRAAAAALIGERPAALLGPATVALDSPLAEALFEAIVRLDHVALLGAALVAKLRAAPIVRMLGEPRARSIDELVAQFPDAIPYVAPATEPAGELAPVLAGTSLACAIAVLGGREVRDASVVVELQRSARVRVARLAAHRAAPPQPLALPDDGLHVALAHAVVTGLVGVSQGELEIHVRVEDRPFRTLRPGGGLPLVAVVDITVERVDESFGDLPADVSATIVEAVLACAPALLLAIGTAEPARLGDRGPAFDLLLRWIAQTTLDRPLWEALSALEAFPTVQGGRVSIARAREPRNVLSTSTWEGDWLGPEADPPSALDAPIVQLLGRPELLVPLQRLHTGAIVDSESGSEVIVDVTAEVASLQASRRMARGLLPSPTLKTISPDLKCKLGDLGELGRTFGHGEIGLVDALTSTGFLHANGVLVRQVPLDVLPPIHIALEAPELAAELAPSGQGISQLRALGLLDETPHPIGARVQELAIRAVRTLVTPSLPLGLRRGLRTAVLANRLDPAEIRGVPVLELLDGTWVGWSTLADQRALFGNVWAVASRPLEATPLDPRRVVLLLSSFEIPLAAEHGHGVMEATGELALDATARRNRARPPALSLAIPREDVLARVELGGDGRTAPRGVVGLLAPWAASQRGVHAHRAMQPLGVMPDPCEWPTIAAIDDARLEPDRTWERPSDTAAWRAALAQLRAASASLSVVESPSDALAMMPVEVTLGGDLRVIGALWLLADPMSAARIEVFGDGRAAWRLGVSQRVAIGGRLFVHGPVTRPVLEAFVVQAHTRLLQLLTRGEHVDDPATAAHLARGLALHRIPPADIATRFTCFSPAPRDAAALDLLLGTTAHVLVIDSPDPLGEPAIIDDGSPLSRVVLESLGPRARRAHALPPVRTPAPSSPPTPRAPPLRHPIQGVIDAVHARLITLGLTTFECVIAERAEPTVWFDDGLRVAGDDPRLRALAAAQLANSPWTAAAIDALVAHVVTVLNAALTDVTDATEAHALRVLLAP